MKSVTRKKHFFYITALYSVATTLVLSLSGCHRIAGNHPRYSYSNFIETDKGFYADAFDEMDISIADRSYRKLNPEERQSEEDYELSYDVLLDGGTAPRYAFNAPEGYDGVIPFLENLTSEMSDSAVIYACGIVSDNALTGYVNVYKDTVGYLSGGGNYAVEEIDHALTFVYNPENINFEITNYIEGVLIVSFHKDSVLYWKDRNYYSYNTKTGTETLLVEDKAYDVGLRHQSCCYILTDDNYVLFVFNKSSFLKETIYVYLYDYDNQDFFQLEES